MICDARSTPSFRVAARTEGRQSSEDGKDDRRLPTNLGVCAGASAGVGAGFPAQPRLNEAMTYVAPAIATMHATPRIQKAARGSGRSSLRADS
jgi:hypothetical protein